MSTKRTTENRYFLTKHCWFATRAEEAASQLASNPRLLVFLSNNLHTDTKKKLAYLQKKWFSFTRWEISNNQRTFQLVQKCSHLHWKEKIKCSKMKWCILRMSCWMKKLLPDIAYIPEHSHDVRLWIHAQRAFPPSEPTPLLLQLTKTQSHSG